MGAADGQDKRILKKLERDAAASAERDRRETQTLIDRHLAERRALERDFDTPSFRQELERAFRDRESKDGKRIYICGDTSLYSVRAKVAGAHRYW